MIKIDWEEYRKDLIEYYKLSINDIKNLSSEELLKKGLYKRNLPKYKRLIKNIDFRLELFEQYLNQHEFINFVINLKENINLKAVFYMEESRFNTILDSSGADFFNDDNQLVFRLDNLIDLDLKYLNIKSYEEMSNAIENKVRFFVGDSVRTSKKRKINIYQNIFKKYQDVCDDFVAKEREKKKVSKHAIPFFYYILSEKSDFEEAKISIGVYEDIRSGKNTVEEVF